MQKKRGNNATMKRAKKIKKTDFHVIWSTCSHMPVYRRFNGYARPFLLWFLFSFSLLIAVCCRDEKNSPISKWTMGFKIICWLRIMLRDCSKCSYSMQYFLKSHVFAMSYLSSRIWPFMRSTDIFAHNLAIDMFTISVFDVCGSDAVNW